MATFQPKLSPKFYYSGDVEAAKRLQARAVQTLFELDRDMRLLPAFPRKVDSRTITNSQGMSIRCEINFGISKAFLFVPPGIEEEEEKKFCACCGDCLFICTVLSEPNFNTAKDYGRIGVKACQLSGYIDLPDNGEDYPDPIYGLRLTDNDRSIEVDEMLLAFVAPPIKRIDRVTNTSLLRTNIHGYYTYTWQVFDCMLSGVREGIDLRPNGIDNTLYTIKEDACSKVVAGPNGKLIQLNEEEPYFYAYLNSFVSSIRIDSCWEEV